MTHNANEQHTELSGFSSTHLSRQAESMIKISTRFHSQFVQTGKEVQKGTINFLQSRFEKDVKFANELMKLNQPGEVMPFYMAFFQEALEDYSNEVVKMGDFGAQIALSAKNAAGEAAQPEAHVDFIDTTKASAQPSIGDLPSQESHQEFAPIPDNAPVSNNHRDAPPMNDQYGDANAARQEVVEDGQYNDPQNGEDSQSSQPFNNSNY